MDAGDVLVDRYRLVDRLGVGGMSVVWRAHDEVFRRDVAVKVLAIGRDHRALPPDAIRSEAQATARLAHAHVANVFDYGEITDDGGDTVPFVVMELLHGTNLAALTADGPLSPEVALRACAEVAAALAEAHAHGLVHRDVKPGNVIMTAGGAKVFDFGIAVPVGTLDDPGPENSILGTPAYVAPERIVGGEALPASDVYALGVLLYRLLTHEYPWPAQNQSDLLLAHVYLEPHDLPAIDGVPDSVRALYRRCIAKEPIDRPTAAETAAVLTAAAGPRTLGDPRAVVADDASAVRDQTAATLTMPLVAPLAVNGTAPARWRPRAWRAAAVLAAVGAIAFAVTELAIRPEPLVGDPAQAEAPPPATSSTSTSAPTPGPQTNPPTGGPQTSAPPTMIPTASTASAPPGPAATGRTFTSAGGTVDARCDGSQAYLFSWEPARGFKVLGVTQGPSDRVFAAFKRHATEIHMTVTCPGGTPTLATSTLPPAPPPPPPAVRA